MSTRTCIINCFAAKPDPEPRPPLLLDLTLWHKWHRERGTLPRGWDTVIDAAKALGTPVWAPFKPWRTEYDCLFGTEETAEARTVVYRAGGRTLVARWTRGPDGDWWQTEYPVKSPEDLETAVLIAAARRYVLDPAGLAEWRAAVGEAGVVPLELPMQPYSDVLHTLVGWGDGLALMLGEGKPLVGEIVASLQAALLQLAGDLGGLDADLFLAPDNLDGQYISPRSFKEYLGPGYAATASVGQRCNTATVVHVGGPARKLVPLLAQSGVAGIEGLAGPPQGDATLADARQAAGPDLTLWGGIPQDLLLPEHSEEEFEAAVREALAQASGDASSRTILGVADRVPVNADLGRLRRLVELIG